VEEHIWFYSSLKGVNKKDIKDEIKQMISDVGLTNKCKEVAKNLSG
jgi:ABC-type multidrug transport system ATPase subunit